LEWGIGVQPIKPLSLHLNGKVERPQEHTQERRSNFRVFPFSGYFSFGQHCHGRIDGTCLL
jgi:hypothetical protein